MSNFYISYVGLAPDLGNPFFSLTNETVVKSFRSRYLGWQNFFARYEGYSLGFIIVTDRGINELFIEGPSASKKLKLVDFSIFLPEEIENLKPDKSRDVGKYLDLVFSGITEALSKFEVSETEINKIKEECKRELHAY